MKLFQRILSVAIGFTVFLSVNSSQVSANDPIFVGPSQGIVNVESSVFSITFPRDTNGSFHVKIFGGGLDERKSVRRDRDTDTYFFTITPTQIGLVTLIANPDSGPKIDKTLFYNVLTPTPSPTPTPTSSPTPTTSPSPTPTSSPTSTTSPSPTPTSTTPTQSTNQSNTGSSSTSSGQGSSSSNTNLSGSSNSETETVTLSLNLPFTVIYDPTRDLVITFELPGGSRIDLATLFIPAFTTSSPATLRVSYPLPGSSYVDGDLDLNISLDSLATGLPIRQLNQAIELRTWTETRDPQLQDEPSLAVSLPLLPRPELTAELDSGFYRYEDGSIQIITKKLSRFSNTSRESSINSGSKRNIKKVIVAAAERNKFFYANFASKPIVIVDLKSAYAGKSAKVQLREYVKGGTRYITLGIVTLNANGDSSLELNKKLLRLDRLRLTVDEKKIIYHTAVTS
ncbi:MAG: hypothetical protein RL540_217 [Actinomycetota bacterium]